MAFITIDKVLTSVKRELGVSHIKLPVSDEVLIEVIQDETIASFSQFYYFEYDLELKSDMRDYSYSDRVVYFLDDPILEMEGIEVLGVCNLKSTTRNKIPADMLYNRYGVEDMAMFQMQSDLSSLFETGTLFKFMPPNKVEIINPYTDSYGNIKATLMLTHARNLSTISPTMREDFLKLATLDIKKFLFPILSAYNNIETTFGTIDLKIDSWGDAADKREDLLSKWREQYLNDRSTQMWVF